MCFQKQFQTGKWQEKKRKNKTDFNFNSHPNDITPKTQFDRM